jgi:hypothetical protein
MDYVHEMVYCAADLIYRVEAQVFEHDDLYTVMLRNLDSGERKAIVLYRFAEWGGQSVALTKAAAKANDWVAPLTLQSRPDLL